MSNNRLRAVSIIVVIIAMIIAGYLTYLKYANVDAICLESGPFDCGTVLNSVYSEINGIPIALLGLIVDVVVLVLLLLEPRVDFLKQNGAIFIFGVVLFAFIYSVYLVYLQAAVILAFCPWCLTHELLITILFIIAILRLRNAMWVE